MENSNAICGRIYFGCSSVLPNSIVIPVTVVIVKPEIQLIDRRDKLLETRCQRCRPEQINNGDLGERKVSQNIKSGWA